MRLITRILTYKLLNPVKSVTIFYFIYILSINTFYNYDSILFCMTTDDFELAFEGEEPIMDLPYEPRRLQRGLPEAHPLSRTEQEIVHDFIHLIRQEDSVKEIDARLEEAIRVQETLKEGLNSIYYRLDQISGSINGLTERVSRCEESIKDLQARNARFDRGLDLFKNTINENDAKQNTPLVAEIKGEELNALFKKPLGTRRLLIEK